MTFVQIIEVDAADIGAIDDLVDRWHREQAGVAPGYRGARILADKDRPGTYLIEVEFSSEEEAAENNERDDTRRWAAALRGSIQGGPRYLNLTEVSSTGGGAGALG